MSDIVQMALIAAIPPTIVAAGGVLIGVLNWWRLARVEKNVDGRLTELIKTTRDAAAAKGRLEGVAEQKAKHHEKPPTLPPYLGG